MTVWTFVIPGAYLYYLVKTSSGWVASYSATGADPFANLTTMSVSNTSFSAHSVYTGGNTGYEAFASGTFASDCTIGLHSPVGHWHSNHDPAGGYFQMYPYNGVVPKKKKCSDTSAARPCPLDVSLKVFGRERAGLAVFRHFLADGAGRPGTRVAFVPPGSEKCASGCLNVVVTVTDSKGNAVPGASVTVHASQLDGFDATQGYLCLQHTSGGEVCGDTLDNLGTDGSGQVRLLYWMPDLLKDGSVTINGVTARKGTRKGSARPVNLSIRPYLIYEASASLTEEQAGEFADFADAKAILTIFHRLITSSALTSAAALFATNTLIAAERYVEEAEKVLAATEAVEPIIGLLEVAGNAVPELLERQGLIATFFDEFDLSAIGLGDDAFEAYVRAGPTTELSDKLLNLASAVSPFQVGADGMLWRYGKALAKLAEDRSPSFGEQSISLVVDEVSHCVSGKPCQPGYRDWSGGGIKPQLYIGFTSRSKQTGRVTFNEAFTIGYDPNAWVETQAGVREQVK